MFPNDRQEDVALMEPDGPVGISRRSYLSGAALAAVALSCALPSSVFARREQPPIPEKSCVDDDWGGASVRSGSEFTFDWTLRNQRRSVSFDLGNRFSTVKAQAMCAKLSDEHSKANYLRMAAYDPCRYSLLAALASELMTSAKRFEVSPLENIIAFVQSIPHECNINSQQWPTQSLLNNVADCSDKTVLAAALIEEMARLESRLGRTWRHVATNKRLWLFLSRENHITIALNAAYCLRIGIPIHRDETHLRADGKKFFFTELNGSPYRKVGEWGSFPLKDWTVIVPWSGEK